MKHGIHHITAIASNPTDCLQFYRDILGLRLVKKSVNQDQVEAYHLFFGDQTGEPGMDLTFFTFPNISQGKRGIGVVSNIGLVVAQSALDYWQDRFTTLEVKHIRRINAFEQDMITFYDQDDQQLTLVGRSLQEVDQLTGTLWTESPVPAKYAIRCFDSATLTVANRHSLEIILGQILQFIPQAAKDNVHSYSLESLTRGGNLIIEEMPEGELAVNAAGTVHHIAFQVADETELMQVRNQISELGLFPTEVIDRYYFKSVYFRTPAGILFELATTGPGFTVDENEAELGQQLALPPFLEKRRAEIESQLEPLE